MSLEIPTWDKIIGALGSTTAEFGGSWGNLISDYYNGVDIGLTDPTKKPIIGTLTRYKNEKLAIFDTDQSHHVVISADDIDTGSTRKFKIRRMITPFEEDYALMEGLPQVMINKGIDSDLNTITNLVNDDIKIGAGITDNKLSRINDKDKLHTAVAYNDQPNTWGAFAQTFPTGFLKIQDADTNLVTLTSSNQSGDFNLNIPILLANDTLPTLGLANTFTAQQLISTSANDPLFVRRTTNTAGDDTRIGFQLRDSASNATTYASIAARIGTNTDTNETGFLDFNVLKNGTLGQYMVLDGNTLSLGLSGVRAVLDATGISGGSKSFTFPNITGQLMTANSVSTMTGKTFDADGSGNSITNIENADIKSGAAIDWTKINKTGSILDDIADVVLTSIASQDILFRNGSNQFVNLTKGSNNTLLGINGSGNLAYGFVTNSNIDAAAAIVTSKLADSANFILKTLDNDFGAHHLDVGRIGSAPASPGADKGRFYILPIDSNNDGVYCKIKKAGSYVEVQIV